jgi:hypothetical protein
MPNQYLIRREAPQVIDRDAHFDGRGFLTSYGLALQERNECGVGRATTTNDGCGVAPMPRTGERVVVHRLPAELAQGLGRWYNQ